MLRAGRYSGSSRIGDPRALCPGAMTVFACHCFPRRRSTTQIYRKSIESQGENAMMLLKLALVGTAALALAGCGTTGKTDWAGAAIEIAKDPNCGHTDRLDIDLGLTGSRGKVFLERMCPPPIRSATVQ